MQPPLSGAKRRKCQSAFWLRPSFFAASLSLSAVFPARADDENLTNEVRVLREQNAQLQQQLQKQNNTLDTLTKKVEALESAESARENAGNDNVPATPAGFSFGKVSLGAEGSAGFFRTGREGFAPRSDFRVDEARLFVEAPIWDNVYFSSDIDLATRENPDTTVRLGELYLDFEDISQLWGKSGQLNARVGRMFIPFGEEYMNRYAMENPLISRSLPDIWGINPGVGLYGSLGKFSYVAAVQNSGGNGVDSFEDDKSIAGRIGFDPSPHWHFSVSGMRTGDLSVRQDTLSAVWFGSGWFRSIGSPATTQFHANLVEGDVTAHWKTGHVSAFGGYGRYNDNDPIADNGRDLFYYSVEVVQALHSKLYAAARFSQILAPDGYPITGFGNYGNYYFLDNLTSDLWRLSLGLGYRFSDNLNLKIEYSFERGREQDGGTRNHEDFFGTAAAFKF